MNEKVLVTISGTQHDTSQTIQTIQQGRYRLVGGKHTVSYQELITEEDGTPGGTVSNLLRISDDSVTLTKRGATCTEMYFKKGEQHTGIYETPFGSLQMSILTSKLSIDVSEDMLEIQIEYGLEMNYSHLSDCNIHIQVRSLDD